MHTSLKKLARAASGFSSDSRQVQPGDIFVALKGENSDGHEFLNDACERGACALIVQKKRWRRLKIPRDFREKVIEVSDCRKAHRIIAKYMREKFQGIVIAVGGSNGKTTTKDFLCSLLSERFATVKTAESQNGILGIPKTLEKLRKDVQAAVIEIGIDRTGQMARHSQVVQPDIAVLTSIGEEHLTRLRNIKTVFLEESILFHDAVIRGKICFAPSDDAWLRKLDASGVKFVSPRLCEKYGVELEAPFARRSASLAIAVARHLKLSKEELRAGLATLKTPLGRGNILEVGKGRTIIADHYNANPSSTVASIRNAASLSGKRKKPLHLVLGDMADLGSNSLEAHLRVFEEIRKTKAKAIVLIGEKMMLACHDFFSELPSVTFFRTTTDALRARKEIFSAPGLYLVKGSRVMQLERLLVDFLTSQI